MRLNQIILFLLLLNIIKTQIRVLDTESENELKCTSKTPSEAKDCQNIEISSTKKCCYFIIQNSKFCVPISIKSYEDLVLSKKEYLSTNWPSVNSYSCDCGLNIETCKKIINPTQKLACTGRKMEYPYSCCFIKEKVNDKTYKSCYPIDATLKSNIDDFAIKYKNDNNLEEEPKVICFGSFIHFSFLLFIFFEILF
jgi:hypothetical protein